MSKQATLQQRLSETLQEKGALLISFYRRGPYYAEVLFKYDEGYWTIQSEAPTQEAELDDWLYTDLIKKQLPNKLMQIRQHPDEYRPENEGRAVPHGLRDPSCFEEFFIEARRNWRDKTWRKGLRAALRAINAAPFGWGLEDGCNGEEFSASLAKNPSYHNGYVLGMALAENNEQ